jgi:iron complex outermembrane receptor protein
MRAGSRSRYISPPRRGSVFDRKRERATSTAIVIAWLTLGTGPAAAQAQTLAPQAAAGTEAAIDESETPSDEGRTAGAVDTAEATPGATEESGSEIPGASRHATEAIEKIKVTARKRTELLEDIPVSVTPLSPALLQKTEASKLSDIQNLVPNLTFKTTPNGAEFNAIIRGVGALEEGEPGVGIYIDGVYLPRAGNTILNVVDIEQIEVLRGPQGTLFGKNTAGGAISITTSKPKEELGAYVSVRPGNFDLVETRFTLDLPLTFLPPFKDWVFTRFSFASANSSGYTDNVKPSIDKTLNNRDALWFLGSARLVPSDSVEININGNWFEDDARGSGGRCMFVQEAPDPAVAGLLASAYPNFEQHCRNSENFRFRSDVVGVSNPNDYGAWGNGTWEMGPIGVLDDAKMKVIASLREQSLSFREDPDMTQDAVVVLSAIDTGDPLDGAPREGRQISAEGQFQGRALDESLVFVTGLFAQWEERAQGQATRALEGTVGDFFGGTILTDLTQDNSDWAIFGQATYDPIEWASLTGGFRYTQERKSATFFSVNPFGNVTAPGVPDVQLDASGKATFDAWTPMASLVLRPPGHLLDALRLDQGMSYFTYSTGFKGGGFNQIAASARGDLEGFGPAFRFEPEFVDSFELGFKTTGFDERLLFNYSFFWNNYTNMQVQKASTIPGANPGDLPTVILTTENAALSNMKGFELETQATPLTGLRFTASFGYLDARFADYISPSDLDASVAIDRAGQTFNDVPEWTTYLALEYSIPLDFEDRWRGWLTPRVDWYYQTEAHLLGPEVQEAVQPAYHLLGARLSYDFFDDRAQVALWARNLTNTEYFTRVQNLAQFFGFISRYYQAPRTFGAEINFRF